MQLDNARQGTVGKIAVRSTAPATVNVWI